MTARLCHSNKYNTLSYSHIIRVKSITTHLWLKVSRQKYVYKVVCQSGRKEKQTSTLQLTNLTMLKYSHKKRLNDLTHGEYMAQQQAILSLLRDDVITIKQAGVYADNLIK